MTFKPNSDPTTASSCSPITALMDTAAIVMAAGRSGGTYRPCARARVCTGVRGAAPALNPPDVRCHHGCRLPAWRECASLLSERAMASGQPVSRSISCWRRRMRHQEKGELFACALKTGSGRLAWICSGLPTQLFGHRDGFPVQSAQGPRPRKQPAGGRLCSGHCSRIGGPSTLFVSEARSTVISRCRRLAASRNGQRWEKGHPRILSIWFRGLSPDRCAIETLGWLHSPSTWRASIVAAGARHGPLRCPGGVSYVLGCSASRLAIPLLSVLLVVLGTALAWRAVVATCCATRIGSVFPACYPKIELLSRDCQREGFIVLDQNRSQVNVRELGKWITRNRKRWPVTSSDFYWNRLSDTSSRQEPSHQRRPRPRSTPALGLIDFEATGIAGRIPIYRSNWTVRAGLRARREVARMNGQTNSTPCSSTHRCPPSSPELAPQDPWYRLSRCHATSIDKLGAFYKHEQGPAWLEAWKCA